MTIERKRSGIVAAVYIWIVSVALILHVFNEFEAESLKVFQIFAAAGFIISLFYFNKSGRIQKLSYFFILFTLFSSVLSPYPDSLSKAIVFSIVLGACQLLSSVSYPKVIRVSNFVIPIPIIFLTIMQSVDTHYRFTGFYNDPNYLCTTLVVFLSLILQYFNTTGSKVIKILLAVEIIAVVNITVSTLSRTGLICIGIIIIIGLWEYLKKHRFIAVIGLSAALFYFTVDTPTFITESAAKIESRENNKDNLSSAVNLRYNISMRGVDYVLDHPKYLLMGLGIGSIGHWEYFEDGRPNRFIDHNTLTSSFSEQGLIGFCMFIAILFQTFRANWKLQKRNPYKLIRLTAFLSLFIFSLSINQMTYLPFWWLIIFLNNRNFGNENHSYSRLRKIG